jgi:hypothetical protein
MANRTTPQDYPRINDPKNRFHGFLDESKLTQHTLKISVDDLSEIIKNAIVTANKKSGRSILNIPPNACEDELKEIYKKQGQELFKYFKKYCGDPASTANACYKRHFSSIAKEQFRNRTLQKERMNSGWRYQFIAKDSAIKSKRFLSVSDIGASEADFYVVIKRVDKDENVSIYVSVKNRTNTMGGQDWPKAIRALEEVAKADKNRDGSYICVFGIAMDDGLRNIKSDSKTHLPHSFNTEVWLSDFFWPFFSNYSYNEIIRIVLSILLEKGEENGLDIEIPELLISTFGDECRKRNLIDENGIFNDPYGLVDLFCGV